MRSAFAPLLVSCVLAGCATGNDDMDAGGRPDVPVISADAGPGCMGDRECDDRVACTIDLCTDTRCENRPCADCCDEGLQCVAGFGCRAAPQPCATDEECLDTVRCTLDYCRDATSCRHDPEPGLCDEGEICLPAVGCIPEPPTACFSPADCEIGVVCVGEWSCDPEFGCQFVSARDCDDDDACTIDACVEDEGGCTHTLPDVDGDGYFDQSCGGDDCNDADADVHPNAVEVCGNPDLNCDGMFVPGCCTADLPCTTSCGTPGRTVCDGSEMSCAPPAETCNGMDDDCDGNIDNGFECVPSASESCATTCGSGGSRTCGSSCTWSTCTPPAETCNGMDDDCDGAPDDTFTCVRGEMQSCTTSCGSTGSQTCNNSCDWPTVCTAPPETCNGDDDDCDGTADEGFPCVAGTSATCATACGSTGTRACLGNCTLDICAPPAETCNGVDDNCNSTCDEGFTCCQGSTTPCNDPRIGFYAGTATCLNGCGGWNTSTCTNCGNGTIQSGELCDGTQLGGATCLSINQGFNGGTLRCGAGCLYDTSTCTRCGNGIRETAGGEQCDSMDLGGQTCATRGYTGGGTLRCASNCTYDLGMCTWSPTGTWVVSPGVNYYCAFGAVSFSFGNLMFTDTGSGFSVTGGGINCSMVGPSARTTRMVNATCYLPGGCNERYTLTGTFTGDNTFVGTFTAEYTGSGCAGCSTRSFTVNGSRFVPP